MSAEKELIVAPPQETALAVYSADKGLEPWLQQIRVKIDEFLAVVPDLKTVKGRKEIASMAYEVARTKTAIENKGKELSAEQKKVPGRIDAERKRVWEILESWQKEVRKPLDDWQAAEDARVDRHNDRLNWLKTLADDLGELSSLHIKGLIAEAEGMQLGAHWEEFEAEAGAVKDKVLTALRAALTNREAFEAEQAELARLRREAEERAEQDRIRAAQEAAVEAERQRVAQEQQAAREAAARREQELIDQAAAQEREAENQRLQLRLQAEQAERAAAQAEADRQATLRQAEEERQAAARRAEEAAEQARQEERHRADAAAAEILRQQEARERDKNHRRNINRAALEAFVAGGMTEECAKQAITLIAERKIPNIQISY
ncbi:hypothetical protein PPUJ13061_32420 [Pseudomonas putida]|uniref:hypothetical protein n=1 Tax=Pseudomonas putida TaxID=303 RepID=UPI000E0DAB7E|nr:hypothetical protein [Pseudomonas putida]WQE51637.1 hypothetical protein U0028_17270 [Pseudomonas putida]GLO03344.1 hypothetical protein PPUJ13061_32420 [Pseudomonas putida]HDS1005750.1 hypothetical protein [Pseudomonas putida]